MPAMIIEGEQLPGLTDACDAAPYRRAGRAVGQASGLILVLDMAVCGARCPRAGSMTDH